MNDWVYLVSFTYPHEANLVKLNLEAEGVAVWMKDELTVQVNNYLSNAIGGVKLFVKQEDYEKARNILIEDGTIKEEPQKPLKLIAFLDVISSKIPFLNKLRFELRVLLLIVFVLLVVIIPLVLFIYPK
jgi:hypothetical protein